MDSPNLGPTWLWIALIVLACIGVVALIIVLFYAIWCLVTGMIY